MSRTSFVDKKLPIDSQRQRRGVLDALHALVCDDGQRYRDTLYDDKWLDGNDPTHHHYADELAHLTGIEGESPIAPRLETSAESATRL